MIVRQAVQREAAYSEWHGDPALAFGGAAEVEVPQRTGLLVFRRQAQREQQTLAIQIPKADGHVRAYRGKLSTVGAID